LPSLIDQAAEVLAFWFAETLPHQWFAKDPGFDARQGKTSAACPCSKLV
jgi:uncharacterized protein (DUF924 family)